MIFDAGAFVEFENNNQRIIALVDRMREQQLRLKTTDAAVAQVWRNPAKQVWLTMLLKGFDVKPFGDPRAIGQLCAVSGTKDVVDASLAVLSSTTGETVLTSDPDDMAKLGAKFLDVNDL